MLKSPVNNHILTRRNNDIITTRIKGLSTSPRNAILPSLTIVNNGLRMRAQSSTSLSPSVIDLQPILAMSMETRDMIIIRLT